MPENTVISNHSFSQEELAPISALRSLGIPFVRLTHPAASTMELCEGIGREYGARHCKNLFLTNRSGTGFFLLLMDPDKPYRTSEVSRRLGVSRLSFGKEAQLEAVLGVKGGSVSVMGLVTPEACEAYRAGMLRIALDSDLLMHESICVHPNVNTASLVLKTTDLLRFLELTGHEYSLVKI